MNPANQVQLQSSGKTFDCRSIFGGSSYQTANRAILKSALIANQKAQLPEKSTPVKKRIICIISWKLASKTAILASYIFLISVLYIIDKIVS